MSELRNFINAERLRFAVGLASLVLAAYPETVSATAAPSPQEGSDVSYPNTVLPKPGAFAIVGLNDINAATFNPSFKTQIKWAERSTGSSTQPKAAIYVHTANPDDTVPDWARSGTNTFGTCKDNDSLACDDEYGQDLALKDIKYADEEGAADVKTVWEDVEGPEDGYTWQASKQANATVLEGMTYEFEKSGYKVGEYSGVGDWSLVVGSTPKNSDLSKLPVWILRATTLSSAEANCHTASFSGSIVMAQISATGSNTLDRDIVCQ